MNNTMESDKKQCTGCKRILPANLEYFGRNNQLKSGLRSRCKECVKQYKKKYREDNKEKISEYNKKYHKEYYKENREEILRKQSEEWYKKHPKPPAGYKECSKCGEIKKADNNHFSNSSDSKDGLKSWCKECKRKDWKENRERYLERKRAYYQENKEEVLRRNREFRELNQEWKKNYDKKYYENNKEIIKQRSKDYLYKRIESDVGFKILQRCRKRLYDALKGYVKSDRTINLIGCSTEELTKHLEGQFKDGMSWDNYGEWHVDHIKPCSMFDFTDEQQQKECFHYTNLQPLWADENLRKSNKYELASK